MGEVTKRLARIRKMERMFGKASRVLSKLDKALDDYDAVKSQIASLNDYLDSGQWREDYEADERGEIPPGMKRGVLSEDGLYNLLADADRISVRIKE